ncbi:MAG: hypothetical protein R3B70_22200 [Polyangiaceae bacterium]
MARETGKRWWIVVDDITPGADGKPRTDPALLSFFLQFALQMIDPQFARSFRLVLLGFPPGPPPSKLPRSVVVTDTTAQLSDKDVRGFIRDFYDLRGTRYQEPDLDAETASLWESAKGRIAAPNPAAGAPAGAMSLPLGRAVGDALFDWVEAKNEGGN